MCHNVSKMYALLYTNPILGETQQIIAYLISAVISTEMSQNVVQGKVLLSGFTSNY